MRVHIRNQNATHYLRHHAAVQSILKRYSPLHEAQLVHFVRMLFLRPDVQICAAFEGKRFEAFVFGQQSWSEQHVRIFLIKGPFYSCGAQSADVAERLCAHCEELLRTLVDHKDDAVMPYTVVREPVAELVNVVPFIAG